MMPTQFLIADYVNDLELSIYEVNHTMHIEKERKVKLIDNAYIKTIWLLDKVIIPELKKPEYLRRSNLVNAELMYQVLNLRGTIYRFLEIERSLLEISGWHESQTDQFIKSILDDLPNIKKKSDFKQLLKGLETLKGETEARYANFKINKAQETMWLERIAPIIGGTALIVLNLKAITIIGDIYSIVSVGVGTNIASNGIQSILKK